jgi:hypothetical protein
MVFAH